MRLIDKDTLLSDIEHTIVESGCVNHEGEIVDCVRYASEVDAVPVVRCGECKYGTWIESCQRRRCDYWTCFRNGMVYGRANTVNENDYCSHGEKMEVEHNG